MKFKTELARPLNVTERKGSGPRHYKTPDGVFPSVTTVLSSLEGDGGLERWRARVGAAEADRITQQGANRGTTLHNAIEKYILHDKHEVETPFDEMFYVQIKKFLDQHLSTIYGLELPVYSKRLRAAGRLDLWGEYKNINSILDFKTSVRRKPAAWIENYFLQTSCYAMMVYERYGVKVEQVVILMATEDMEPVEYIRPVSDYIEKVVHVFKNYKG
jgi:CRISPR/Cas system-associated exonuclease Cas4 (RecB family)